MCLGVPGQVIKWLNRDVTFGIAVVEFAGTRREIHMACVPEAMVGQYIVAHAGIAICRVDEGEAKRTIAEFRRETESHAIIENTDRLETSPTDQAEPL